jgi:cyclohexyl-isocyanide hydratase
VVSSSKTDPKREVSLQIGLLVFPNMTQLDLTGPLQVFSSVAGFTVHLIGKRIEPVTTDTVLVVSPTITFADCPQLDVICVPGGHGTDELLGDAEVLAFIRAQAEGARYVTSVCTGALVLGAAGLLRGYRATTHWSAMDCLVPFGAIPTKTRVCIDRNRVTGGGVTAGIDFALALVAELLNREAAEAAQLRLEYNPDPPFDAGNPDTAPKEVVAAYLERTAPNHAHRVAAVQRAAAGWSSAEAPQTAV